MFLEYIPKRTRICHSESPDFFRREAKKLDWRDDAFYFLHYRFLAPLGMTFTSVLNRLLVLLAVVLFIIPWQLMAQPASSKSIIKVVLVSGGASGLSAGETDSFFSNLQAKLSQFATLSVCKRIEQGRQGCS
jgi:hypothetical protein